MSTSPPPPPPPALFHTTYLVAIGTRHDLVESSGEWGLYPAGSPMTRVRHGVVDVVGVDNPDHVRELLAPVGSGGTEPVEMLRLFHDAHVRLVVGDDARDVAHGEDAARDLVIPRFVPVFAFWNMDSGIWILDLGF